MKRPSVQGFTLIELLVAASLALVVLFAASSLLMSSSGSATNLQARNDLVQEGQIAMNYVAANVREAAYVYPNGTALNLGGGTTTRRPGGGNWVVGDANAPILAFIKAPRGNVNLCSDADRETRAACYYFIAYYPVIRSEWVSGVAATGQNNPGEDAVNTNRWLLVEYRCRLPNPVQPTLTEIQARLSSGSCSSGNGWRGEEGRLLLDYVQPALPNLPPLLVIQADSPQTPGNVRVTMNLSMNRLASGKEVSIPARTSPDPTTWTQALSAAPRNIGTLTP